MGWIVLGVLVVVLVFWIKWRRDRARRVASAIREVDELGRARQAREMTAGQVHAMLARSASDDHVLHRYDGSTVTLDGPRYELRYIDGAGDTTTRRVALLAMDATAMHFQAYCYLRSAERTFAFENILRLADLETGEIIPVADLWQRYNPGKVPPPHLAHEASARVSDALVCFARDHLGGLGAIYKPIVLNAMRAAAPADRQPDQDALLTILNRRSRTNNIYRATDRLVGNERLLCLNSARAMAFKGRRRPNREAISYAEALFTEESHGS